MFRFIVFVSILFTSFYGYSQVYFTYGYGANFANVKGLNQFVDNYNTSRSWLNKEMKSFSYVDGFTVSLGLGAGGGWLETEYAFRGQKRFANGIDALGDDVTRQVKLKQGSVAISIGGMFLEENGGVAFGVRSDMGTQKLLTRLYETGMDKPDWEKYDLGFIINTGPTMKIFLGEDGALGTLSFYYTFGWFKTNVYELEADVNHSNPAEKDKRFDNKNNVFGINLAFGIYGA